MPGIIADAGDHAHCRFLELFVTTIRVGYYRARCYFLAWVERRRVGELADMRSAMNEVTRAAYVRDCDVGLRRWHQLVQNPGAILAAERRFRRSIGVSGGVPTTPRDARSPTRRGAIGCLRPGTASLSTT